jgi:hypothetical protein
VANKNKAQAIKAGSHKALWDKNHIGVINLRIGNFG